MITGGVVTITGSGTPPADGGAAAAPICYPIGGCVFSENSRLSVRLTLWTQAVDCSLSASKTTATWSFASRTATTMTWSGTGGSATYDGVNSRWTYTLTGSYGFDTSGAGPLCLSSIGPEFNIQTCTEATFYRYLGSSSYAVFELWLMSNDCIPSIAV